MTILDVLEAFGVRLGVFGSILGYLEGPEAYLHLPELYLGGLEFQNTLPDLKLRSALSTYNSSPSKYSSGAENGVAEIAFWSEPSYDAHCTAGVVTDVRSGT